VSLYRRATRKDASHSEVVLAFQLAGASVVTLSAPGMPDLLVGLRGAGPLAHNVLVEVKAPLGPKGGKSHRELLPTQVAFAAGWRGDRPWVVRSAVEARAVVAYYRDRAPCEPIDTPAGQDPEAAGHTR
jgi:hypothetical protein